MNNKGFTLMEILAVVVILVVVTTFAIPGIRALRSEIYYLQAKSAANKMGDAMRSYYQNTKGYRIVGKLAGRTTNTITTVAEVAAAGCNDQVNSGVPTNTSANSTAAMAQLFGCDYLMAKDFNGLPYIFLATNKLYQNKGILVKAFGTSAAGKYANKGWCVARDSSIRECEAEEDDE